MLKDSGKMEFMNLMIASQAWPATGKPVIYQILKEGLK